MSDNQPATRTKERVTFSGWGYVYNPDTKKLLCKFEGGQRDDIPPRMGKFTTDNPSIIKKLDELGYKRVRAEE